MGLEELRGSPREGKVRDGQCCRGGGAVGEPGLGRSRWMGLLCCGWVCYAVDG